MFGLLGNIIAGVVLLCACILGYKKGLLKMAVKPVKNIICLVLSFELCGFVGNKLVKPIIVSMLNQRIFGWNLKGRYNFPSYIEQDKISTWFTDFISDILANLLAFLILFILLKGIVGFILTVFTNLLDHGMLGKMNRVLGLLFAGALSVLAIYLINRITGYATQSYGFAISDHFLHIDVLPFDNIHIS